MAKRRALRRLLPLTMGLGLLVSVVFVAASGAPAGADETSPPNAAPLGPSQSIWFSINPSSPSSGQTVTLSVAGGNVGPADLWGAGGNWPGTWSANGITLTQAGTQPCSTAQSSCSFTVDGSPGSHDGILFGINLTPAQVQSDQQSIVVPAPPTTTTTTTSPPVTTPPPPDSTFTGPPNGQLTGPGQFTFQSAGVPGVTYQWTLMSNGAPVPGQSDVPGQSYTPPPSIFSQPGTYTLTLKATSAGQISSTSSSVQFVIQPSNPQPPQNNPTPQPPAAAPPAAPAAAPPAAPIARPAAPGLVAGLHAVSYVPQLPSFSTPVPGAVQPVTVIWLWRPDWFQPSSSRPRLVRTGGRPSAVKRANVSVDPKGKGPSAAPLLAGLAAFGIFGAGWVMFKRRQVRSSLLD